MHMVTVDSPAGSYTYDADMAMTNVDNGLAFMTSQLSNLETRLYETKYPHITFEELVPVSHEDPDWADSFSYISYDAVTMGKFISGTAKDLPESDLNAAIHQSPLFYGGNAFSYSLDDLRKSQQLRMPVDVIKGKMSQRGFYEHAQKVAFFGDAERGITGLFNNANVAVSNSAGVNLNTISPDEFVALLNRPLENVWINSNNIHIPNVIVIPSSVWTIASRRRMGTNGDSKSILNFFKENNLFKMHTGGDLAIKTSIHLETAGVGGTPRMMAYELNDENLTMRMPFRWRAVAPQPEGLSIKVPAEYKMGGVEYRFPGSATYVDFT